MFGKTTVSNLAISTSLALFGWNAGVSAADLDVSATISNTCILDSGSIAFGTYLSGQPDPLDATGSIGYQCSPGLDVDFELDGGANNDVAARLMGATNSPPLQYQLFSDSGFSTVWGTQTGGQSVNVDPTLAGAQTLPIFARVPGSQSPNTTDSYNDTVVFSFVVNP